jgi:hypothetical protein
MKPTARRLVATWIVGAVVGTAVIAISSPLFVRTYAPLHADPVRGAWTLPEGETYRWRSEGYADTQIGPFGMPGKTSLSDLGPGVLRVALWGDSQAEGVCVRDDQKLFAQAQQISVQQPSRHPLQVFPLARSGEDAADWVTQMPAAERQFAIDLHVLLIVDLPDLIAATDAPVPAPSKSDVAGANAAIAARLPAFVIQAARYLLTQGDETTPRQLRFSIGPLATDAVSHPSRPAPMGEERWLEPLMAMRRASALPILILYAPKSPQIVNGKVVQQDASATDFEAMKVVAQAAGIAVVDVGPSLRESARQGKWPHGFHNGVIGSGHLNAQGYAVVASQLVSAALEQGN